VPHLFVTEMTGCDFNTIEVTLPGDRNRESGIYLSEQRKVTSVIRYKQATVCCI
jgi:hypothetical protein